MCSLNCVHFSPGDRDFICATVEEWLLLACSAIRKKLGLLCTLRSDSHLLLGV